MGLFTRSLALAGLKLNGMYILLASLTFILFAFSNPEKVNEKTTNENEFFLESKEHLTKNLSSKQSTFFTNSGYFEFTNVPGKYSLMSARFGNEELILRPNMIEYFNKQANGLEESIYLVFQGSTNKSLPKGRDLISKQTVPIPNKDMAEVLGTTTMEVTQYQEVVYENIYDGVNLIVRVEEKGLTFEMESLNKSSRSNFKLVPRGAIANTDSEKSYTLRSNGNNSLVFSSEEPAFSYSKEKGFKVSETTSSTKNTKFKLSIK